MNKNKHLFVCVSTVWSFSFQGSADTLSDFLVEKQVKKISKSSGECTDFSGDWVGKCTITATPEDGEETTSEVEQNLEIKQSECSYFIRNGRMIPFGGSVDSKTSTNGFVVSSTEKNMLNSTNDRLITDSFFEVTTFGVNSLSGPSTTVMWIDSKELATDESAVVLTRNAQKPELPANSKMRIKCRYKVR